MLCPHCDVAFHDSWTDLESHRASSTERLQIETTVCPNCQGYIVRLRYWVFSTGAEVNVKKVVIFPARKPPTIPAEVPEEYARDYREAVLVLADSPKASAALSRRIVQHVIREKAGIRKANLNSEIDALIETDALPGDLAQDLHALRTVGNFAAHPIKSTNTGEVVEVEPGEAEWLLDLLNELFDFHFVRPARRAANREALNTKLADAGKPPLEAPSG